MSMSVDQLPAELRRELPPEACELYVAAYNRIREKAAAGAESGDDERKLDREAHDGAMLAVQTEFERDDRGRWRRAPIGDKMDQIGPAADDEARDVISGSQKTRGD